MKVGLIQPSYLPWRGYFDFIDDCDLFLFFDNTQYTSRDWRNRNYIKSDQGLLRLTVPVKHTSRQQLICDTFIDHDQEWDRKHISSITQYYHKAPYFSTYSKQLFEMLSSGFDTISEMDIALTLWVMDKLGIETRTGKMSDYQLSDDKTGRIINLLQQVGASSYLSGPSAETYLDTSCFTESNISLEYKSYDYPVYQQQWGDFCPQVSVVDLLFNTGPDAMQYLKSTTPNRRVT